MSEPQSGLFTGNNLHMSKCNAAEANCTQVKVKCSLVVTINYEFNEVHINCI